MAGTIIETAKANGPESYWYFRYLLERLPDAMTEDDYKALLPQYLDKAKLAAPSYRITGHARQGVAH